MKITGPWMDTARAANLLDEDGAKPSIFARMSARAIETGALNLGQGFPDTDPPAVVAETAREQILAGSNQYPPGMGVPVLREAIAEHQRRCYGLDWDPDSEVLVTTGATEALAATILALVSPGDEVLTLEPFFDAYAALIGRAGGVHRTVPVRIDPVGGAPTAGGDLRLSVDAEELRAAVTDRTRLILMNTPHNPTGLVLPPDVVSAAIEAAHAHDAFVVTDEVYEHLDFTGSHRAPAALPGGRERTVSISSAGKTFSVTGWKIGWITAREELITAILAVKQWLTYVSGAPFQPAIAAGLRMPDQELAAIREDLQARRDLLVSGLREVGFALAVPDAGYFVVADGSPLGEPDGAALCERLPEEAGVVAIPVSAFHLGGDAQRPGALPGAVRFAFCKDRPTIEQAVERLGTWAQDRRG